MELFKEGKIEVKGILDMKGSEDMTITIPKNSGKYSIDLHPI